MKIKRLWTLFCINILISSFTFGGGYVVITMIRKYYVEKHHFFDEEELSRIAAIAQSSPGAIAINMTALAGYKSAGKAGLIISCFAAVLPPLVILSIISSIYTLIRDNQIINAIMKGTQAGVAALIVDVVFDMYLTLCHQKQLFFILMAPIIFIFHYFFHMDIAIVLFIVLLICILKTYSETKGANL